MADSNRLLYIALHASACIRENFQVVLSHRIGLKGTRARTMLYTLDDARLTPDVIIGLAWMGAQTDIRTSRE